MRTGEEGEANKAQREREGQKRKGGREEEEGGKCGKQMVRFQLDKVTLNIV